MNCSLRDAEANIVGNLLKSGASELQGNSRKVPVIAFGCSTFVLSSGAVSFELSAGVLEKETRDGRLFNPQFGCNLALRCTCASHTKSNTNLAFDELFTGHVYLVGAVWGV